MLGNSDIGCSCAECRYAIAADTLDLGQLCEALPVSRGRRFAGKLPLAIVVSLIIQVGGLIWLSASVLTRVEERLAQQGERLGRVEAAQDKLAESMASVSERVARAEEYISGQSDTRRGENRWIRGR